MRYNVRTMARRPTFSPVLVVFVLAGVLLLIGAVVVRMTVKPVVHMRISEEEYRMMEEYVANQNQVEPQLDSSTFTVGDALVGVGGNWTYIEQSTLTGKEAPLIAGTTPTRQSRLKAIEGDQQMALHEARISDDVVFDAARSKHEMVKIGEREARLVLGKDGSSRLLLAGQTTIVLITPSPLIDWKQKLPEVVATYIASVRIP